MASVDGLLYQTGFTGIVPDDVAAFLGRNIDADETSRIKGLVTAVEYDFASQCHRNFSDTATYYEFFSGGVHTLQPTNTPILSLSKVFVDNVDVTTNYTLNTNYWINANYIRFLIPIVGTGVPFNAVKIEYKIKKFWGEDVIQAIKQMVAYKFLSAENAGVGLNSLSFSNISQQFDLPGFKKQYNDLIFSYTNFNI